MANTRTVTVHQDHSFPEDRRTESSAIYDNNPVLDAHKDGSTTVKRDLENETHCIEAKDAAVYSDTSETICDQEKIQREVTDLTDKPFHENQSIVEETSMDNRFLNIEAFKENVNISHTENVCPDSHHIVHNTPINNHDEHKNIVEPFKENHIHDGQFSTDNGIYVNENKTEKRLEVGLQNISTPVDIEGLYDETTPKRIQRPNKLKIPVLTDGSNSVIDNIDRLISPDDKSPIRQSPNRLRRIASVERPLYENQVKGRPIIVYNEPEETDRKTQITEQNIGVEYQAGQNNTRPDVEKRLQIPGDGRSRGHYKKSPDLKRKCFSSDFDTTRRSESPVLRLKSKSVASSPYSKSPGRKISLDARLSGRPSDTFNKQAPIRKISSNARLEHTTESTEHGIDEEPKCRKVSFGATTYITNIEKTHNQANTGTCLETLTESSHQPNETQRSHMSSDHDRVELRNDDFIRAQSHSHQLTKLKENENDFENIQGQNALRIQNHYQVSERYDKTNGINDEHYDNKAYIDDENIKYTNSHALSRNIIDSQTGIPLKVRKNTRLTSDLSSSMESLVSFEADKSFESSQKEKKLSTISLPCVSNNITSKRVARHSVATSSYSPKPILKIRRDEPVSNLTAESINEKSLERDSLAMYSDQNGNAASSAGHWVGPGRKDFKRLWESRYDLLAQYKVHIAVFVAFLLALVFVVIGVKLHKPEREQPHKTETFLIDPDYRRIHLFDDDELDEVTGTLGMEIPDQVPVSSCYMNVEDKPEMKCMSWEDYAELTIVHKIYNKTQCYDVRWILNPGVLLTDCYDTAGSHWFGPTNSSDYQWPLKSSPFAYDSLAPSVVGTFSTVAEYLWLSSKGVAIIIVPDFPVHISWNEKSTNTFCISRSRVESSYPDVLNTNRHVQYRICNGINIVETYRFVRSNFFPRVIDLPHHSLLLSPHWSSSSEPSSSRVNDTVITNIAKALMAHKLSCSMVEIDAKWESKYGDFTFDNNAFSNIETMLKNLTDAGCALSVKVYPYVNYMSDNFREGLVHEYFVKSSGGNAPALLQWEHGVGAMVDVTNPVSRDWFNSKLRNLRTNYNISAIRFGYGKLLRLPRYAQFHTEKLLPNKIIKLFSSFIESTGHVILERTSQTQNLPSLINIPFEIVKTEERKCLKNVIPKMLAVSMLGYPFLLSDGFDLQNLRDTNNGELPSPDLFIRWMEISSFFAAVKYTVKPWQYDDEVIKISKNLTRFHEDTVIKTIESLKENIMAGQPIFRPMWWSDPKDENTYLIDDQFFFGENMIVAPILCEGKAGVAERNIYFPKGIWRDSQTAALIPGPKWIQYYNINQNQMGIFTRELLFESIHKRIN